MPELYDPSAKHRAPSREKAGSVDTEDWRGMSITCFEDKVLGGMLEMGWEFC